MIATIVLVVSNVYINQAGPFRLLVDTGAQSTSVTPATAARIGLEPEFRIEHVTASGARLLPAGYTRLRWGGTQEERVETIICDLPAVRAAAQVDGVLGQSWLQRFNYLIDYDAKSFTLNPPPPDGSRIPFKFTDGRPAIAVRVDRETQWMILDSGATGLVLFGPPPQGRAVFLNTNNGATPAFERSVRIAIPGLRPRRVPAVVALDTSGQPGLLPLNHFSSVYVNNADKYVVVTT